MAEDFTNFVLKLAEDPQTLAQFREHPTETMKSANLSPAEQSILLSGNAGVIREAITADVSADEVGGDLGGIWPIYVVVAVTVVVRAVDAEGSSPE
jgi:hypothetical protein